MMFLIPLDPFIWILGKSPAINIEFKLNIIIFRCARGEYLKTLAQETNNVVVKDKNLLGVEIRRPVVEDAQKNIIAPSRVHVMYSNVSIHLQDLVKSLNAPITSVSIFHPDPWFKAKHHRRRLVNIAFCTTLADVVQDGCDVYLQTDVKELSLDMVDIFRSCDVYKELDNHPTENPLGVASDREAAVLREGGVIYRHHFRVVHNNS